MNNLIKNNFKFYKRIKFYLLIIFLLFNNNYFIIELSKKKMSNNYKQICENIAKGIESLKKNYPQLKEFNVSKNLDKEKCKIEYEYKCHLSVNGVGWVSQVPNPDPDGLWLYINLWNKNDPVESFSQINTQPVMPLWYINERCVTFLILEGKRTRSLDKEILKILKKYGLRDSK